MPHSEIVHPAPDRAKSHIGKEVNDLMNKGKSFLVINGNVVREITSAKDMLDFYSEQEKN